MPQLLTMLQGFYSDPNPSVNYLTLILTPTKIGEATDAEREREREREIRRERERERERKEGGAPDLHRRWLGARRCAGGGGGWHRGSRGGLGWRWGSRMRVKTDKYFSY